MRIKILGKTWNLRFTQLPKDRYGDCDDPNTPNPQIRVSDQLKGEKELCVLIHEMLHASCFLTFSEEYVDQVSKDIAKVLWKLNYKKINTK